MMKRFITLLLALALTAVAIPAATVLAEDEMRTSLYATTPVKAAGDVMVDEIRAANKQAGEVGKYDDKTTGFAFSVEPYGAEVEAALGWFEASAVDNGGTPIETISLSWIARITIARAMLVESTEELTSAEATFLRVAEIAPAVTGYADTDTGMIANYLLAIEASSLRGAITARVAIATTERTEADRLYAIAKEFYKAATANAKLATEKSSQEYAEVVEQTTATYTAQAEEYYAAAMAMLAQSRGSYANAANYATETAEIIGSWTSEFQKEYVDSGSAATVSSMEKEAVAHQKLAETADYVWPPK